MNTEELGTPWMAPLSARVSRFLYRKAPLIAIWDLEKPATSMNLFMIQSWV